MQEVISFFIVLIVFVISFYVLTKVISHTSKNLRSHFESGPSTTAEMIKLNYHIFNWNPVINNKEYFYNLNDELIYKNINTTINSIMEYKYKYYFVSNIIVENHRDNLKKYFTDNKDQLNNKYLDMEISNIERILFSYTKDENTYPMITDILLNVINLENIKKDEKHIYFLPYIANDDNILTIKYNDIDLIFIGLYKNGNQSLITYPQWEPGLVKLDLDVLLETQLTCKNQPIEPQFSNNERFLDRVCKHLENILEPSYLIEDEWVIDNVIRYSGLKQQYEYMDKIEEDKHKLNDYKNILLIMENSLYNIQENNFQYNQYLQQNIKITLPSNDKIFIPNNRYKLAFI